MVAALRSQHTVRFAIEQALSAGGAHQVRHALEGPHPASNFEPDAADNGFQGPPAAGRAGHDPHDHAPAGSGDQRFDETKK